MKEARLLIAAAFDQYKEICYDQPQSVSLPKFNTNQRSASRISTRPTQWLAEGRNLASRASSRASFTRRPSYRPTIGAPSDFRRVERNGRIGGFRPLELSIYLPGNELPSLPVFSEDAKGVGLEYPAQALTKARSDSMLSRPSTSFTIPRKPVASRRTFSLDGSCASMESRYTGSFDVAIGAKSLRRPSLGTTQSTQDFLDTLDARLPQSPPKLRSKSGPEPIYTLYRRASEQSLRLRTHLEEREQIERRLPECDTILEEKYGDERKFPTLSPISSHDSPVDDSHYQRAGHIHNCSQSTTASRIHTELHPSLDNLLGSKSTEPPSTRSRISQWLHRSASSQSSPSLVSSPSVSDDVFPLRDHRTSTASTLCSDVATPWTTPRSSPRRKGSSFSSFQLHAHCRGLSFDGEKMPPAVSVGVAF